MTSTSGAWLHFYGKDSQDFLQRLSTVDTRLLKAGDAKSGFFLNPTGKIIAYFFLHSMGFNDFVFEFENEDILKSTLDHMQKFHFAEKIQFETLLAPPDSLHPKLGVDITTRISQLIAAAPFEINSDTNPLELGLRSGIAEQKGCYPGQEVIEKIISLGQPARRLGRFESAKGDLCLGKIFSDPTLQTEAGSLTTLDSELKIGLGLIKKNYAQPLHVFYQKGCSITLLEVAPL